MINIENVLLRTVSIFNCFFSSSDKEFDSRMPDLEREEANLWHLLGKPGSHVALPKTMNAIRFIDTLFKWEDELLVITG